MTTLANIRKKVRRLTASPSAVQITDVQIDEYINTFYLHDLPQHLKLFDLKEVYTFYTEPNIDVYNLNANPSFTDATVRAYYSIQPPVYVAGSESYYSQSRAEFFRVFPMINAELNTAGTGIAGAYAITTTDSPVMRNHVTISATGVGGNRLIATDDGIGGFTGDITAGAIDYVTGAITALTFTNAIPATENITVQYIPYVANKPTAILFYDNQFTLRPIPDKTYPVTMDCYIYPTVLLNAGDSPEIQFLWQLLAIGAAKKVYQDRGDIEGDQSLERQFYEQMLLCQRRTMEQLRTQRAGTIYSAQAETYGNLNYNNFRG
jgi:hypothetical protein